jgi:hypothetical protein
MLLTYILTYSMEQSPSWEANEFPASQEFLVFYGTRRFITAFTSAHHLSLSWASTVPVQVRGLLFSCFATLYFLRWGVVNSSNSQAGEPPFVGCPQLFIQYIRSYPPYWRPTTWGGAMPCWEGPTDHGCYLHTFFIPTCCIFTCYSRTYRICTRNLHTFSSILAAEKSGCVKYADFFLCVEVLIWVLF